MLDLGKTGGRASERSLSGGERPPSNLPNPVVLLVEDPCRPQPERNRHRPDGDGDAEDVEAGQHGQQGQDHQRQQRQPAVLRWVAAPGGWGAPRGQGGAAGSLVLSKVCGPAGVRGNGRRLSPRGSRGGGGAAVEPPGVGRAPKCLRAASRAFPVLVAEWQECRLQGRRAGAGCPCATQGEFCEEGLKVRLVVLAE